MSEKSKVGIIERDEVFNNIALIAKEYDITIDIVTGQVWLASNHDNAVVILQGLLPGYSKENDIQGTIAFDRSNLIEGTNARFTGAIYFKDLPCNTVRNGTLEKVNKDGVEVEPAKVVSEEIAQPKPVEKQTDLPASLPDLDKSRPKTLKAPDGLSRTQRKIWWDAVRAKYPDAFDSSMNYIGYPKVAEKADDNTKLLPAETQPPLKNVVKEEPLKRANPIGDGNVATTMAAQPVRAGYFMGIYFPAKDGYSVISAPATEFDKSKLIFTNKERTAEILLEGLRKNPSFAKKLNGEEKVFPALVLKPALFNGNTHVWFVTNPVTALQALGDQVTEEQKAK